jgi:hypothetical protein
MTEVASNSPMPNRQDQLVQILKRLQVTANQCASSFSSSQLKVEYRVAFSAGAALPWRLIEIHRAVEQAGAPRLLRRMHYFRSCESLDHSIRERTTWKARDQALVKSYLVRVRASIDSTSPGQPGSHDTQETQYANADLLQALTATRQALRARMCATRPDRAVDLPKR